MTTQVLISQRVRVYPKYILIIVTSGMWQYNSYK